VTPVEETEEVRHAGGKSGLGHSEEPAAGHKTRPVEGGGLQGGCEAPGRISGSRIRRI